MKKKLATLFAVLTLGALTVVNSFAALPSEVNTAFSEGVTNATDDMKAILIVVIPAVMGVLGITIAIRFGIRFFKGLTASAK